MFLQMNIAVQYSKTQPIAVPRSQKTHPIHIHVLGSRKIGPIHIPRIIKSFKFEVHCILRGSTPKVDQPIGSLGAINK